MGNLDDIFKDNFGAERSGLPADQESQLWDSIVDELGDENSIPAPPSQIFSTSLIIALLVLTMIPLAFYLGRQSINDNGLTDNGSNSELLINDKVEENELVDHSIISPNKKETSSENEKLIKTNNHSNSKATHDSISNSDQIKVNQLDDESNINIDAVIAPDSKINENPEIISANENNSKTFDNRNETLPLSTNEPIRKQVTIEKESIVVEKATEVVEKMATENVSKSDEVTAAKSTTKPVNSENGISGSDQNIMIEDLTAEEIVGLKEEAEQTSITKNNEFLNASFIKRMKLLTFDYSFEDIKPRISKLRNFEPIISEDNKDKGPWKFSITGVAGANRSGINYTGSNSGLSTRKNSSERAYYGQVFGANFSSIYKSKWIVNTGLHHEIQRTIYDETFNKNVSKQVNYISGILVNSQSYAVLDEYNVDSTIVFSSVNKIKQINSFSSYSIPVQLGYQWTRSSFSYGIMAGATLRIRANQQGKLLDIDQELVDLDNSLDLFYNSFNIGINASPFIEYRINEKWLALANYDVTLYKPIVSLDQSLELYNSIQTIRIGLRYYLK
ncbi:hypothetical protein N9B82_00335 [Saprospiraceae bacterium]|nr:hypothetical protein [Saprospiraceae bacterium]